MNKIEIGATVLVSDKIKSNGIKCLVLDMEGRKISVMDDESNSFTVSIKDVELCLE